MSGRLGSWLRFGLPGVGLGVLLSWGAGFHGEPGAALAQEVPGRSVPGVGMQGRPMVSAGGETKGAVSGEAGGIVAMVTNPSAGAPFQWLYLIDTRKRAFAIYRVDPNAREGTIKLEASRRFHWDLDLDNYNNYGLEPADVKARVEALNRTHTNP